MLKKSFILLLIILFSSSFTLESQAQGKFKVAIVRLSNRVKYLQGQEGMVSGLREQGFDETKVEFEIKDAQDSEEKLREIARELKGKKLDLIMTIATLPSVVVCREVKDTPIVFGLVSNPVSAGLVKSWESSGNNVTGASAWVATPPVINILREIIPMKRFGYLCNSEEEQTAVQTEDFKGFQDTLGYTLVIANAKTIEEATDAARSLVGRVDAIFIGSGSVISKGLEGITEVCKQFKIPTVVHADDKVEQGVLLAVSPNSFRAGELAGQTAAEVLRGKHPSQIPIKRPEKYDIIINLDTAKEIGISIPVSLLKIATKVIKEK